jgi:hypothetical protein
MTYFRNRQACSVIDTLDQFEPEEADHIAKTYDNYIDHFAGAKMFRTSAEDLLKLG